MELGKENLSGLLTASDEALVDDIGYNKLLGYAFSSMQGNLEALGDSNAKTPTQPADKKAAFALTGFITECARVDASQDEIKTILEENKFNPRRIQLFLDAYNLHKESTRTTLSRISSLGRARIVDVNWRLDYNIKSGQSDRVNQLSYLVNLHTQEPGVQEIQVVSFTCSHEQLQDLVGKLKDAVRCVEKQVAT